ncbi:MAG: hypothetical protein HFH08_06865 [Bacilli bacterium]|nr:hypothetical protein [Bacilli bacterium]
MTTPTYQIKRNNVFIGQVVKTNSTKNKLVLEKGKLSIYRFIPFRSILFTLTEQPLANDLLYDSPEYPVLNHSPIDNCLNSNILIQGEYNLGPLLNFFQFPESLSLLDIKNLRKHFFNGSWSYEHCDLFGFREILPQDWTYVKDGHYVKDPEELKQLQKKEQILRKRGHRVFEHIENGVLPSDMMFILGEFGDHSIAEILQGFAKQRNAFKPHEEEGIIKKLSL